MKAKFIINCCIGLSILLVVSGCSLGEGGTETSVRAPSSQSGSDSGSNSDNGNPNLGSDSSSSSSDSTSDSSGGSNNDSTLNTMEQSAFSKVNEYRASKGLAALTWSANIATICREHSVDMAAISVLSHDGFEARAATLQASGASSVGENVAYNGGFADPASTAVTGWINSPGHEANMVGNYTKTGMGVAISSNGSYYFTQIFTR
jgi:uncharacterized protein YkwD